MLLLVLVIVLVPELSAIDGVGAGACAGCAGECVCLSVTMTGIMMLLSAIRAPFLHMLLCECVSW